MKKRGHEVWTGAGKLRNRGVRWSGEVEHQPRSRVDGSPNPGRVCQPIDAENGSAAILDTTPEQQHLCTHVISRPKQPRAYSPIRTCLRSVLLDRIFTA